MKNKSFLIAVAVASSLALGQIAFADDAPAKSGTAVPSGNLSPSGTSGTLVPSGTATPTPHSGNGGQAVGGGQ